MDGSNWTQQTAANGPSVRANAMMAYDAAHGQTVLFGGFDPNYNSLNDTWTWDGSSWTQKSPASSPSATDSATMAYDAASGQVVLFGGESSVSGNVLNATWTWDGSNWTQQSPTNVPEARIDAMMSYDTAHGEVVLFGGYDVSTATYLNDTWIWNGSNWTNQNPAAPPPATWLAAMAYDAARNQSIAFGGLDSSGNAVNATWALTLPGGVSLGAANVCPSGATAPAPCSQQATLAFQITGGTTVGSISVLTQGATALDFNPTPSDTSTTLCTAQPYSSTTTCTVDVTFTPTAPGQRIGAVVFKDGSGNPLSTSYLYGTGTGPDGRLPAWDAEHPGCWIRLSRSRGCGRERQSLCHRH